MEEEFIQNQERLKPQEEKSQEERAKVKITLEEVAVKLRRGDLRESLYFCLLITSRTG